MSNVPMEALDPEELRRFLENQEVVGGGLTFGELAQQEATDAEIARQDAAEEARLRASGQYGLTYGGREPGGGIVPTPPGVVNPVVSPSGTGDDTTTTTPVDPFAAAQAAADAVAARALAQQRTDAFSSLRALLARVGLGELEGAVQDIITSGRVSLTDPNAIVFALRDQPKYQQRFAANKKRLENGLPELTPETYIGLEEQYRQVFTSNGLPMGFYNDQKDFEKFIEGDVSPAELQSRIREGYAKVRDADPAVVEQMRQLYNVSPGDLAAYFIDPERTRPLLTAADYRRQAEAASISARGLEQGGLQLTAESAEDLARRGITSEEAESRFGERRQLAGLFDEMTGEESLTEQEKLGATFGYDPLAQEKLNRRRAQRVAEFQGGGSFARTTGATSGTVETGIGAAQ